MKTEPHTLIILTPGFAKDEADSTCLPAIQNFVSTVNSKFAAVKIIILAFDYPFFTSQYQWKNNRVVSFNGYRKQYLKKLIKWITIWTKLNQLKRENNITGILSFWCGECAWIGNRYAKRHQLKHYCWIQGQDAKKENRYVKLVKPSASEMIALSDLIQKEFFKNHGILPQHIIPLGIDATEFREPGASRDIDILGAGSLIPLKRYDIFIEVVYGLKEYFPQIKAVLCGKGTEEANLKKLVEKYGVQKNILLTDELPHAEMLHQMKRAKLLLHTSSYEGLGVVCIEALAAGATVVSFCKPMNADIMHWYIVNDKEAMIKKAIEILNDPAPRYVSVIPFTMQDTAKKIMQLYGYNEAASV